MRRFTTLVDAVHRDIFFLQAAERWLAALHSGCFLASGFL